MDEPDRQETGAARNQGALYANYFQVGHNAFEFLLEFGQMYEGEPARIHTRIIATPYYARTFLKVFQTAMEAYERNTATEPAGDKS